MKLKLTDIRDARITDLEKQVAALKSTVSAYEHALTTLEELHTRAQRRVSELERGNTD